MEYYYITIIKTRITLKNTAINTIKLQNQYITKYNSNI